VDVDILVNNVGDLIQRVPFDGFDTHVGQRDRAQPVERFSTPCARCRHRAERARIVNISSLTGISGAGKHAFAYAAAKGGMVALTKNLALEFAPRNIRVNCVAPGVVKTPFPRTASSRPEGCWRRKRRNCRCRLQSLGGDRGHAARPSSSFLVNPADCRAT
jgi:NAD(P)-dependent dehydrogenase (short-subunit alcohol dehydrogenase family)